MADNPDLEIPKGLSPEGEKAYAAILSFLVEHKMLYTGGCKAFHSPAEWKERGEDYGLNSLLIICHDGGDLAPLFNYDYERYDLVKMIDEHLRKYGVYAEGCTCWYSAIYPIPAKV